MKLNFTPKVVMLALVLSAFSLCSFAQSRSFFLSKVDNAANGTVTINVMTKNFTMIEDFQFSIDWDPTVFSYKSNSIPTTALGLNASDLNAKQTGVGLLWYDATLSGVTVPDSTVILSITLSFINYSESINSPVTIGNVPVSIGSVDTTDGNFSAPGSVPCTFVAGYVSTPVVTTISQSGSTLTVNTTGATAPPSGIQIYTVTSSTPGGPGTNPVYTYTAIPGATSNTYVGTAGVWYAAIVTYASGAMDTSAEVLPLRLLNFKGNYNNRANILTWATSNEVNTSSFEIERSIDGQSFYSIGSVASLNSNSAVKTYNFTDANLTSTFTFYYRIKMIDADGAFAYSSVVKLNKAGKAIFQVQPNPIENSTVKVYGSNMKQAKIIDMNGKVLLNQPISNPEQASFIMNNIAKGVYMINVISTDGISQTDKFIVK